MPYNTMLVSPIINFNNTIKAKPVIHFGKANFAQPKIAPLGSDTFEKVAFKGEYLKATEEILSKFDKFDIEEYDSLKPSEIEGIRTNLTEDEEKIYENALEAFDAGSFLKDSFDKEYGKDNYVYISIGRSCASIAKALEFMGVESKIVPMSDMRNMLFNDKEGKNFFDNPGLGEYIEFLHGIGLSPDIVKNSHKHYIFQDLTSSGRSLKYFKKLMETDKVGLGLENVHFESVNNKLKELGYPDAKKLEIKFACCDCKGFSTVDRLFYKYMGDVKKSVYPEFKPSFETKLFNFFLIDTIKSKKTDI